MTVGFIHEFNNILRSIQGFTDLALLRIGANGPNRQGLEQIRIGTERVTELLGQLEHFHMEASASQPVTLGLVLKGYGKSLAFEPALAKVTESGQIRPTVLVQVRDTNIQVLARPTQVQDLLVALHRVACGVSTDVEDNCRPQLVLQQASTEGDENDRTPPRLELLLQGLGTLPEGSEAELGQLAEALGGVMSVRRPADNCISYRVSLPGLYPVLPIPSNRQLNT
ncbi:MAG: hypothetical protein GX087_10430 [Desulfobulbaceae bacterium]|nr:hypothetical protein [Desulfobulbaceae bacterium]